MVTVSVKRKVNCLNSYCHVYKHDDRHNINFIAYERYISPQEQRYNNKQAKKERYKCNRLSKRTRQ